VTTKANAKGSSKGSSKGKAKSYGKKGKPFQRKVVGKRGVWTHEMPCSFSGYYLMNLNEDVPTSTPS